MGSKISKSRVVSLSGLKDGQVVNLPVVCIRKNFIRSAYKGRKKQRAIRFLEKHETIGIVSHPTLCRSGTAKYIDGWCHPFRQLPKAIKGKPALLLSESDFVDPRYVQVIPKRKDRWDFFFFTMGGKKQRPRKGVDLFIKCLDKLCGKHGLRGIVINYASKDLDLSKRERRLFNSFRGKLKYKKKKLSPREVAKIMATSKFGFFPNFQDCSPLLLTESLVRDTPILVNTEIYGGWKYVSEQTGREFSLANLDCQIEALMTGDFEPRSWFLEKHGFENSARIFAEWGQQHFKGFANVEKACFSGLSRFLKAG